MGVSRRIAGAKLGLIALPPSGHARTTPRISTKRGPLAWREVINDKGYTPVTQRLAIFSGRDYVVAAKINGILVGVVAEAHRHHVQVAVLVDGRQSPRRWL